MRYSKIFRMVVFGNLEDQPHVEKVKIGLFCYPKRGKAFPCGMPLCLTTASVPTIFTPSLTLLFCLPSDFCRSAPLWLYFR
jgi:hypothetical protein